jgi:hypothetical protein
MFAMTRPGRPAPGTVLGCLALIVATGGVAVAAIPGSDGTVTGCLSKTGALKIIDTAAETCPANQTVLRLAGVDAQGKVRAAVAANTAANADALDGIDSTGFLRSTAKAADADLLDGKDSADFLGATAKAADADKLDGRDGDAYISHCDAGTVRVGDLCYETALRPATNWFFATSNCGSSGRELPSYSEMYALWRSQERLTIFADTAEPMLTSEFVGDLVVKAPSMSKTGFSSAGTADTSVDHPYLCVEDPSE